MKDNNKECKEDAFLATVGVGGPLTELIKADVEFGTTVEEIVSYLLSTYDEKYVNSPIGNPSIEVLYSAEHGKGVNIFNALKYIQRYMSEGFEKSDNPKDVVKAIHYLIFELTRLNKHANQ